MAIKENMTKNIANSLRQVLVFAKYFLPSSSRVCTFVVLFSIYFSSFLFLFIGLGARLAKGLRRLARETRSFPGCVAVDVLLPHDDRYWVQCSSEKLAATFT